LWVREKWVGLELPLAQASADPVRLYTGGVLSGPRTWWQGIVAWLMGRLEAESGFLVAVIPALEVLERARPDAAAWWKENAAHLVTSRQHFLFRAEVCRVLRD
jgi:hypothetical protein